LQKALLSDAFIEGAFVLAALGGLLRLVAGDEKAVIN
jgi:hypothetical protein